MRRLTLLCVLLVGACAQSDAPAAGSRAYAISDRTLGYSYAGGTIKPIPNTPPGTVRDGWNDAAR